MSLLASLTDFKALMEWSGSTKDALATSLLTRASAIAEQLAGRPLRRQADVTEYPTHEPPRTRRLYVNVFPIESVTSVKQLYAESTDDEFTAETAMTEITDYVIESERGKLVRSAGYRWIAGPRYIQVVYTGGYYDPSGSAPSGGAIAVPDDLQHAVLQQAIRMFQTKDTAGLRQVDLGEHGGSVSLAESKAHPMLIDVCRALRRVTL